MASSRPTANSATALGLALMGRNGAGHCRMAQTHLETWRQGKKIIDRVCVERKERVERMDKFKNKREKKRAWRTYLYTYTYTHILALLMNSTEAGNLLRRIYTYTYTYII
jgi:hypothetical protein